MYIGYDKDEADRSGLLISEEMPRNPYRREQVTAERYSIAEGFESGASKLFTCTCLQPLSQYVYF
jgi:hypothetical protein